MSEEKTDNDSKMSEEMLGSAGKNINLLFPQPIKQRQECALEEAAKTPLEVSPSEEKKELSPLRRKLGIVAGYVIPAIFFVIGIQLLIGGGKGVGFMGFLFIMISTMTISAHHRRRMGRKGKSFHAG